MSNEKVFLPWNKQVKKLQNRNLVMRDVIEEKNARYALQNNSYYSLVNGYKDIFCSKNEIGEDDFQDEPFVHLRDAFDFDKELSAIVFKYLLRIEDSLKAIFSYYVGEKYGHKEKDYLLESNYRPGNFIKKEDKTEREKLLQKLKKSINDGKDPQLKHYRNNYSYTPPWVLVSSLSLDTLMYWFKLSRSDIKKKTIETMLYSYDQYPCVHFTAYEENVELFNNLLTIVKEYRNRSAHGNRIMNHISNHNIKINFLSLYAINYRDLSVVYKNGSLNRDVMSLFVAITIMLSKRNTVRNLFIKELESHYTKLEEKNIYLYKKIMKKTLLPYNFSSLLKGIVY